ncbi:MAG: SDR family oxidoreductase [Clostridia bacterium]|nr:SDR family oxidoreductase [Clostridia bacterium]
MSLNKTAVVTGASGGIGSAIAKRLCSLGFTHIVICCNKSLPETLKCEIEEMGVKCTVFQGALGTGTEEKKLFSSLSQLDLLVNCAGVSSYSLVCQTDDEEYKRVMQTNLDSVFYCMREASSLLLQSKGQVINISSVWGVCGASCESVYSATKAGVIGFTKAWAKEYAPMGVRVNAVAPGVIDTKMMQEFSEEERQEIIAEIPLGRMGTGEDIADCVEFLVKCDYITGQTIVVDGGYIG